MYFKKMDIKNVLTTKIVQLNEKPNLNSANLEKLEENEFQAILRKSGKTLQNFQKIPKFFHQTPGDNEPLRQKLREEARSQFLKSKEQVVMESEELGHLWSLLNKQNGEDEHLITYEEYKKIAELGGAKVKYYLKPSLYAKLLQGDKFGRIPAIDVFNYVMRKSWLENTRAVLGVYDTTGNGYLNEKELENFITELLPTLCQLDGLEKSFHSFYVCTVVRKFLFFLDPNRTNKVRIVDILTSFILDDLLELRDENLTKELQEKNWFSAPSTFRVYGQYLNLDQDHNGMLNKQELTRYGSGTLTKPFLDRIFQTCLTYSGEMDYKTYLDLVLALENRQEPQSIGFLFRILDINGCGYLDALTLNYFFKGIEDQMRDHGPEHLVSFSDLKDELFDMARPQNAERITLSDLINCEQGDTFVGILIEYSSFWAYEHREAVLSEPQQ